MFHQVEVKLRNERWKELRSEMKKTVKYSKAVKRTLGIIREQ